MIRQRPFSSPFGDRTPYYAAGRGVWSAAPLDYTPPPPPVISTGILQEAGSDFIMLEDGSSYILQEA